MILPEVIQRKSLFSLLYKIDQDLCEQSRVRGCPIAGGRYIVPTTSESLEVDPLICARLMKCASACAAVVPDADDGYCRRRFDFGRVGVYWAPVMLIVSALRQGQNPDITLERLKGLCGVWRSTVKRWQRYFCKLFSPHDELSAYGWAT